MENGKSYDVGPNGGYVDSSSLDLLPKTFGLLVLCPYVYDIARELELSVTTFGN